MRGDVERAVRLDVLDLDVALPVDVERGPTARARTGRRTSRRAPWPSASPAPAARRPSCGCSAARGARPRRATPRSSRCPRRGPACCPGRCPTGSSVRPSKSAGSRLLELVGELLERVGDGGVEHGLRPVDRRRRADRAELELVAGEGERRGPVAVRRVLRQDRQRGDAELEVAAVLRRRRGALLELLDDVLELRAEEDRHDRRRRLVRAEAMVLAGVGDARAEEVGVDVDRRG